MFLKPLDASESSGEFSNTVWMVFPALKIMGYNDILPFAQLVNAGFQPSTALPVLRRLDGHGTRLGGMAATRNEKVASHSLKVLFDSFQG